MNLVILTILFTLLCSPTAALAEKQVVTNLSFEFSQFDDRYTFHGSFFTMSDPDALMHILYDFEHLTNFVTGADSILLLRQGENWYEVCYTYRRLFLENKFTYRKTLIQGEKRITFEMIASEQTDAIFPRVLSSRGYYEIKPEGKGCKVVYFEEGRIGSKLPNKVSSHMAKREATKFLQELGKYVERKCY